MYTSVNEKEFNDKMNSCCSLKCFIYDDPNVFWFYDFSEEVGKVVIRNNININDNDYGNIVEITTIIEYFLIS